MTPSVAFDTRGDLISRPISGSTFFYTLHSLPVKYYDSLGAVLYCESVVEDKPPIALHNPPFPEHEGASYPFIYPNHQNSSPLLL